MDRNLSNDTVNLQLFRFMLVSTWVIAAAWAVVCYLIRADLALDVFAAEVLIILPVTLVLYRMKHVRFA